MPVETPGHERVPDAPAREPESSVYFSRWHHWIGWVAALLILGVPCIWNFGLLAFLWGLAWLLIVFVPIGVLYCHSQSVRSLPLPPTAATEAGRNALSWISKLLGFSLLLPVACFLLLILSSLKSLTLVLILIWLALLPLLLVARMLVIYIYFSRFTIRALMLSVFTIGALASGITRGSYPIQIACGISAAMFLAGWIMLLEDFHRSKREPGGVRSLLFNRQSKI